MRLFYAGLKEGKVAGDALYEAKLGFLANADSRLAHPFYWAGYVANGDSGKIEFSSGGYRMWWILIAVLLGLGFLGGWVWRRRRTAST